VVIHNKVQLITYPDSLGGDIKKLDQLLLDHFQGIFPGGVHILPPFPSSGDRGFAPTNYFQIESRFGSWEDIQNIACNSDILLDLMVNHISRHSAYFQDFMQKGRRSIYSDLFIPLDKIWSDGKPSQEDVSKIFLRKPEHPFSEVRIGETGEMERLWTTFGTRDWSEQIDLDVNSLLTRDLFKRILVHFASQGVKMVRLDAVAYVNKKPGTSCFFIEPEIYDFLNWIRDEANSLDIDLLPEVHAEYSIQQKLADHGFWVYNFALPLLVLHTLLNRSSRALREHLKICPVRQFTQLDCHDGIPVQPDVNGLLDIDDAQRVVQLCLDRGANLSRILSGKHQLRPDYDTHQINCTYFSALREDEDAYLSARAIQFFTPGVPQVYYIGLLAGENDQKAVELSGERRAINRHNYTIEEVESELRKPVVQRLLKLIRFRNEYDAFDGEFEVLDSSEHLLKLNWKKGEFRCILELDLKTSRSKIHYWDPGRKEMQSYWP
jgi:sucrose phosphorylase